MDFLPTVTIAAKNLATEMTNYNVEEKDLQGEPSITEEHILYKVSPKHYFCEEKSTCLKSANAWYFWLRG